MTKSYIFLILTTSLLWCLFSLSCAPIKTNNVELPGEEPATGHAAVEIHNLYMPQNQQMTLLIPYHINLMALDLLRTPSTTHLRLVKRYMEWYLDHLNYPDLYGTTGSIYDYHVFADGREVSLNSMDSVDSYAATFIMLVEKYSLLAEDPLFPQMNRQKLDDIVYLIPYLQQADGLTIALPNTTGKYLMDNCEALAGIAAYVNLAERLGWESRDYYIKLHDNLLTAIESHFYNPSTLNYHWLIDGTNIPISSWNIFYPDSYAQLFPIVFGVISDPVKQTFLWNQFHYYYETILPDIPVEQRIIYEWTKEVINK